MRIIFVLVSVLLFSNAAYGLSGSVVPRGKLMKDPYEQITGLAQDKGASEDEGGGEEAEALFQLTTEKPIEYWLHYARSFSLKMQDEEILLEETRNDPGGFLVLNRLGGASAEYLNANGNERKRHAAMRDMVYYSAAMSTWKRARHMRPDEFEEFVASENCVAALGNWYCESLRSNGFRWSTQDGGNYLYMPSALGLQVIAEEVKNAYFN